MHALLVTVAIGMSDIGGKTDAFSTIKTMPRAINAQFKLPFDDDDMFNHPLFVWRRFTYCAGEPSGSKSVQSRVVDHKETTR